MGVKSSYRSLDLVNKKLINNNLINQKDRVLISFSGGQDSICLLFILNQLYSQLELDLALFWCHHLWQTDSFYLMEQVAKVSFLFQFNSCFAIPSNFISSELLARKWRQSCGYRVSLFYNYSKICLAHTSNDKVETIFFNFMRGTGLTGLSPLCWTQFISKYNIIKEEHISQHPYFKYLSSKAITSDSLPQLCTPFASYAKQPVGSLAGPYPKGYESDARQALTSSICSACSATPTLCQLRKAQKYSFAKGKGSVASEQDVSCEALLQVLPLKGRALLRDNILWYVRSSEDVPQRACLALLADEGKEADVIDLQPRSKAELISQQGKASPLGYSFATGKGVVTCVAGKSKILILLPPLSLHYTYNKKSNTSYPPGIVETRTCTQSSWSLLAKLYFCAKQRGVRKRRKANPNIFNLQYLQCLLLTRLASCPLEARHVFASTVSTPSTTPKAKGFAKGYRSIIRPLLSISRFEINKICYFWKLPIYPDISNQKVKFLRNRVRRQLLPTIKFFFNSKIENTFLQLAEIVEIEDNCLTQIVNEFTKKTDVDDAKLRTHSLLAFFDKKDNKTLPLASYPSPLLRSPVAKPLPFGVGLAKQLDSSASKARQALWGIASLPGCKAKGSEVNPFTFKAIERLQRRRAFLAQLADPFSPSGITSSICCALLPKDSWQDVSLQEGSHLPCSLPWTVTKLSVMKRLPSHKKEGVVFAVPCFQRTAGKTFRAKLYCKYCDTCLAQLTKRFILVEKHKLMRGTVSLGIGTEVDRVSSWLRGHIGIESKAEKLIDKIAFEKDELNDLKFNKTLVFDWSNLYISKLKKKSVFCFLPCMQKKRKIRTLYVVKEPTKKAKLYPSTSYTKTFPLGACTYVPCVAGSNICSAKRALPLQLRKPFTPPGSGAALRSWLRSIRFATYVRHVSQDLLPTTVKEKVASKFFLTFASNESKAHRATCHTCKVAKLYVELCTKRLASCPLEARHSKEGILRRKKPAVEVAKLIFESPLPKLNSSGSDARQALGGTASHNPLASYARYNIFDLQCKASTTRRGKGLALPCWQRVMGKSQRDCEVKEYSSARLSWEALRTGIEINRISRWLSGYIRVESTVKKSGDTCKVGKLYVPCVAGKEGLAQLMRVKKQIEDVIAEQSIDKKDITLFSLPAFYYLSPLMKYNYTRDISFFSFALIFSSVSLYASYASPLLYSPEGVTSCQRRKGQQPLCELAEQRKRPGGEKGINRSFSNLDHINHTTTSNRIWLYSFQNTNKEIKDLYFFKFFLYFFKFKLKKRQIYQIYWPYEIFYFPLGFQRRIVKLFLLKENRKNIKYSKIENILAMS